MDNSNSLDLQTRLSNITIVLPIGIPLTIVKDEMMMEMKGPKLRRSSKVLQILLSSVLVVWRRLGFSSPPRPIMKVACIDVVELMAVHTTAHSACGRMECRLLLWCACWLGFHQESCTIWLDLHQSSLVSFHNWYFQPNIGQVGFLFFRGISVRNIQRVKKIWWKPSKNHK